MSYEDIINGRITTIGLMVEYIRQDDLARKWEGLPGEISARQMMNAIAERLQYNLSAMHK